MIARDLIDADVRTLSPNDDVRLLLKAALPVSALPIVTDDGQYLGLLHRSDLPLKTTPETRVEMLAPYLRRVYILPTQHPFEVIKLWVAHPVEVFPVVEANGRYEGAVSLRTLRKFLMDLAPFGQQSLSFEVYTPEQPYAMRDLIQALEGNGIQVLLAAPLPTSRPDEKRFLISVPAHQAETAQAAVSRRNYRIEHFGAPEEMDESLRERIDYLHRLIEM